MGAPRKYVIWCAKCKRNIKWARGQQKWYHEDTLGDRLCGQAVPQP